MSEECEAKLLSVKVAQQLDKDVAMDIDKSCAGDGPPAGTSSPLVAAMSTVNLVVGVGILYLPNTFIQCGMIPAVLISAIVAYFSWYTSQLIVRIGMKTKKYSYEEICQVVLGDFGYVTLAAACILFDWGACLTFMLSMKTMVCTIIARYLQDVDSIQNLDLATPENICLILCLPPLWGLSLLKDLDALSFASIVKAVVVSLTVITIFITSQTAAVQDTMEFTKWEPEQVKEFFKDITDGEKVDSEPVYSQFLANYQKDLEVSKAEFEANKLNDIEYEDAKMAHAWSLVDAVDNYEFKTANAGKVRGALRFLVNRENPKPRLAEYDENGDKKKEHNDKSAEKPPSYQQPPGIMARLGYFSPYLFCSNFFTKLGTICFAFVFHDSIFSVFKTLKTPTIATWKETSVYFMWLIFGIQVAFGVIIALTFGTSSPENVLTSSYEEGAVFPADNVFSQIIQIAFSVVLLLTYPACIVICREFVESIIVLYWPRDDGSKEISRMWQLILASILVLLTVPFLFSPEAGDMADKVLDFVGSLACGYMAFMLPAILYWKVYGRVPAPDEKRSCADRYLPYIVFALGIYTVFIAPIFTILSWAGIEWEMPLPPQGWKTEM